MYYISSYHDFCIRFSDTKDSSFYSKYFKYNFIHRDFLDKNNYNNMIDIIKQNIDLDYIVLINIDAYYLKAYNRSYHFLHEVLIYGYDDKKQEFLIKDFFDGKNYKEDRCHYQELVNAFKSEYLRSIENNLDGILSLDLKNKTNLKVYKKYIKDSLIKFVDQKFDINHNINYGITVFDAVVFQMNNILNNDAPFQFLIYSCNFLKTHIYLMQLRVEFLSENNDTDFEFLLYILFKFQVI